jgi:hypothetical protein
MFKKILVSNDPAHHRHRYWPVQAVVARHPGSAGLLQMAPVA